VFRQIVGIGREHRDDLGFHVSRQAALRDHQWSGELFAIEAAFRPRPSPGDADYESAKDHSGGQCLADPIALPQTKQRCAHGDYAEKLQRPFNCSCLHEPL
jgi:hypothetical protein